MKKKVLHIVEPFASGVFSFLVDLVNETSQEFDITIAYGVRKETVDNFKEYFNDNVKFIKVENFDRNINIKKDIKAYKELKEIKKHIKPDIVHLHSSKAGVLGRLAMNGKKIKMLYNPHGFSFLKQDDSKIKRLIYKAIEKIMAIFNRKCTIIGCSQGEYEEARKLNDNSVCINNGINIEKLQEETKSLKQKEIEYDKFKICTVGRIDFSKNPQLFNEIAKNFPNIQFTWIGDGDLRDKLTSANITITGWKEKNEVLKILNENDIFILTSLWEGLPISLLEAMYMKKICIVTNVIGNRDVIKNEYNGFVIETIEECEKYIKEIIEKKNNQTIVNNAFESIQNEYNTKVMINNYMKIYN